MVYIGIDPGISGGIAVVTEDGDAMHHHKMPETPDDVLACIGFLGGVDGASGRQNRAMLEKVSASPQMGVVSAFTFGKGYGALQMALAASKIAYDEVTPQKWQKAMQCLTRGDKNVSKRRAQQLFPQVKVTHAIADALLIAEYCRRFHKGML